MNSLIKNASKLGLSFVAESKYVYGSYYPKYVFEDGTNGYFMSTFSQKDE